MSFTITYHRFFSVRVKEVLPDEDIEIRFLSFIPTPETQLLFNDHQLVFKKRESGFDVYYRTNDDANIPLVSPIESKTRFSFSLKVTNPSLFAQYEPDFTSPQIYLDNLTASGNISNAVAGNLTEDNSLKSEDLVKVHDQSFTIRTDLSQADPPTKWQIKSKFTPQSILQTVNINNPDGADFLNIKLNDPIIHKAEYISEEGPYILSTDKTNPAPSTIYLSNYLSKRSINGVLDIYWDSAQTNAPNDTGKEYQIIFKRK